MSYKLTREELSELDKHLAKAFKKGVSAIKEEIISFIEEKVPYE